MFNRTLTQQLLQRGRTLRADHRQHPAGARSARGAALDVRALLHCAAGCGAGVMASAGATAAAACRALPRPARPVDGVHRRRDAGRLRTRMMAAVLAAACASCLTTSSSSNPASPSSSAPAGVATVVLFLAAALVAGRLASRLRLQVVALRASNAHATAIAGPETASLPRPRTRAGDHGRICDRVDPAGVRADVDQHQRGVGSGGRDSRADGEGPDGRRLGPAASGRPAAASPTPWAMRPGGSCRFGTGHAGCGRAALSCRHGAPVVRQRTTARGERWWRISAQAACCARGWSRTWRRPASPGKPSGCVPRCCRRCRMTCARRWRRSSVPRPWTCLRPRT
jgi:hypothetical protein